ncbi:hypothetical protein D3C79_532020 [compost metagenome]
MAIDVLFEHAQRIQLLQHIAAFVSRQADDAGGEAFADEQCLAAVFRVGAHHRVNDFLHLGQLLGGEGRTPVAFELGFSVTGGVGVSSATAIDHRAQGGWHGLPGFVHVGKQGIAALAGQFLSVEHGTQAGEFFVGQVRMPELAGITQANVATVLDDVGNDQDLGMAGQQELLEHMDLQFAETATELDVLLRGDALVAEHQDVVVEVGAVNTGEILGFDRFGQVQADDLGAYGTGERTDFKGLRLGAVDGRQGVRGGDGHCSLPRSARLSRRATIRNARGFPVWVQVVRRIDWSTGTQ